MAKKESVKKTTAKKTAKKVAEKKVEKIEEVVIAEPVQNEEIIEDEKTELNYESLYKDDSETVETESETQEDKVTVVSTEIPTEAKAEILPTITIAKTDEVEETVNEPKENAKEVKKENNGRTSQKINGIFGYFWNGQEMDY